MIELIGGFLQHNLIVLVAVVLVPMKLVILKLCGDGEAQRAAWLSIPEDLVYVSLGLVLGDFASAGGAFRKHFEGSHHVAMNLLVTVLIGSAVAVFVHVVAMWTNSHLKDWRAASEIRAVPSANPLQGELGFGVIDTNIRTIQVRTIALASMLYLAQLGAAIWWLSWIARVLANG